MDDRCGLPRPTGVAPTILTLQGFLSFLFAPDSSMSRRLCALHLKGLEQLCIAARDAGSDQILQALISPALTSCKSLPYLSFFTQVSDPDMNRSRATRLEALHIYGFEGLHSGALLARAARSDHRVCPV